MIVASGGVIEATKRRANEMQTMIQTNHLYRPDRDLILRPSKDWERKGDRIFSMGVTYVAHEKWHAQPDAIVDELLIGFEPNIDGDFVKGLSDDFSEAGGMYSLGYAFIHSPRSHDLSVAVYNSPPEWVTILELAKELVWVRLDLNGYLILLGATASGIVVIGTAKGVANGLQEGLHKRISKFIAPETSEDEES